MRPTATTGALTWIRAQLVARGILVAAVLAASILAVALVMWQGAADAEAALLKAEFDAIEHVGAPFQTILDHRSFGRGFVSSMSEGEVRAHYDSEMQRDGWMLSIDGRDLIGRTWICYAKGDLGAKLLLSPSNRSHTVELRYKRGTCW